MDEHIKHHILSFIEPEYDFSTLFNIPTLKAIERKRKLIYDLTQLERMLISNYYDFFNLGYIQAGDSSVYAIKKIVYSLFSALEGSQKYGDFMDKHTMFVLFKKMDTNNLLFRPRKQYYYGKCGKSKFLL